MTAEVGDWHELAPKTVEELKIVKGDDVLQTRIWKADRQ